MKSWSYILLLVLLAGAFLAGRWTKPCGAEAVRRDTVILRDTLAVPVPTPERVEVIRRDTCWLSVPGKAGNNTVAEPSNDGCVVDSVPGIISRVPVIVPIERKVYATADYRAVVEGYRPQLVSMELYRQTQVVTNTVTSKPKRWGVGIQAGYGLTPRTGRFEPYIGIGIQYSIWQW